MDIKYTFLAQNVEPQGNGHNNIVGFDTERMQPDFYPARINLVLCVGVVMTIAEANRVHYFRVIVESRDGERVGDSGSNQLPHELVPDAPNRDITARIFWRPETGLVIPKPETYIYRISLDGRIAKTLRLYAERPIAKPNRS